MKNILFFLGIFFASQLFGQHHITGTVSDAENGDPIPGVNVYISELSSGVVTDAYGKYTLNKLPEKELIVQFSFIGYQTVYKKAKLNDKDLVIDVALDILVIQGQEVVVSGNFSSAQHQSTIKINTVSVKKLTESGSPSLVASITEVPGVDLISNGPGIGTPVIRGLSTSNILFLNNGMPLENYQFSPDHPYMVDEHGIEKVEIIKGPASLIYGSGAVGGIINLIAEPVAPENRITGDVMFQYFGNTQGIQSNVGIKGNQNGVVWGIRGGVNSNKDFIQGNGETAPNSRFNRADLKLNTGIVNNKGSFRLFYEYNRDNLGIPNEFSIASETENQRKNKVWFQDLANHMVISKNMFYIGDFKMNFDASYQFNHRKLNGSDQTPVYNLVDMSLQTLFYSLKSMYAFNEKTKVTFGFQGMNQQNKNREAPNHILPDAISYDLSGYALVQAHLGKRFILEGGLRYSYTNLNVPEQSSGQTDNDGNEVIIRFDNDFSNLSASLGTTIKLTEKFFMRLNLSSAFRNPNIAELTQYGLHETRFEVGDPNLIPQQNQEADFGLHYHSQHTTFDLDGFYNNIDHYITLSPTGDTTTGGDIIYLYSQTKAQIYGGEASVHFHPHPLDWLHFEASWQYAIGKQNSGGYLPFIPAQKIHFALMLKKAKWKDLRDLYIKGGADIALAQNNPSEFEDASGGYTLTFIGIGFNILMKTQLINISLNATNLLDITYYDHLSLLKEAGLYNPGRSIVLYIKVPFLIKN